MLTPDRPLSSRINVLTYDYPRSCIAARVLRQTPNWRQAAAGVRRKGADHPATVLPREIDKVIGRCNCMPQVESAGLAVIAETTIPRGSRQAKITVTGVVGGKAYCKKKSNDSPHLLDTRGP